MPGASPAASSTSWECDPAWADTVEELRGLAPDDWSNLPGVSVVKSGPHRSVYRVDRPQGSIYLKHYRAATWRSLARSLVRASAARREWRKSTEMTRRGVPIARAVAWGEDRRAGLARDNFFASAAIEGAIALDEYLGIVLPTLTPPKQARAKHELARRLAVLVAQSHEAGVWHDDFHAGNILLARQDGLPLGELDDPTEWRLHLVDLPGVRLKPWPLAWRSSRASLAMLCSGLLGHASRTDRLRFWKRYLAERPEMAIDADTAGREVMLAAYRHARRVFRRRDGRAWAANRDFYRRALASGRAHAVQDLSPDELHGAFDSPGELLRANLDRPWKLSHSSVVVEAEIAIAGRTTRVALKRCRPKPWWKSALALLRGTRARVAWFRGQALVARRIATARPLAVVEPRSAFGTREGYLLTEWLAGAANLHLYGWELATRDPVQRRRRARQLAASLGELVGRLHAWRLAHRDLKGCNLLAIEQPDDVRAALVDLDGLSIRRWLPRRTRWRDLARLAASCQAHPWVSRADHLRFLRAYFRAQDDPALRSEWKRWWRAIGRRAGRVTDRLAQRGDVVA